MLDHVHHLTIIVSCLTALFFELSPYFADQGERKVGTSSPAWHGIQNAGKRHRILGVVMSRLSQDDTAMTAIPLHQQQWHREDGTNWYKLSLNSSSSEECQGETTTKHQGSEGPGDSTGFRWNPVESGGPCRNFLRNPTNSKVLVSDHRNPSARKRPEPAPRLQQLHSRWLSCCSLGPKKKRLAA